MSVVVNCVVLTATVDTSELCSSVDNWISNAGVDARGVSEDGTND